MATPLFIENTITINAPAARVWDVLTNPQETKKYMFGCETVSDWKQGSSLEWRAVYEGKEMTFVKGTVREIRPGKFLEYTTFDPLSAIPDEPENYLAVTYDLQEADGQTILKVTQGDYSKVADSERRYKEAYNNGQGWNPILEQIKAVAETK